MIKNMIFDVGEVLFSYRWKEMLTEHGLSDEEAEFIGREMFHHPLWCEAMDGALMPKQEIIEGFKKAYPKQGETMEWFITHPQYMQIPRPEIYERMEKLQQAGYRNYLLSNYSEDFFLAHTKNTPILDLIDGRVISYEVHTTKPHPEIYQCLLNKYALKPQECLFFDDRLDNVQAAEKKGIHTILVTSREQLGMELDKWLSSRLSV